MSNKIENIINALQQTISSSLDVRSSGEGYLLERTHKEGFFLKQLCEVCSTTALDPHLRSAAAIYVKNSIRQIFVDASKDERQQLSVIKRIGIREDDVTFIRDNLVEVMVMAQDFQIRKILGECAKTFAFHLLPNDWPNVLDQIDKNISSNEQQSALCGLIVLKKILKRYKFQHEKRESLDTIMNRLFPRLLSLATQLLTVIQQASTHQNDAFMFLLIILQCYHSAIFSKNDKDNYTMESLDSWMNLLVQVIRMPFPENLIPEDADDFEATPMVRCEKRALKIVFRLFQDSKSNFFSATTALIVSVWEEKYAAPFAQETINCLKKPNQHSKRRYYCYRYIASCFEKAKTNQVVTPHFQDLQEHAFHYIRFNDTDREEWQTDPAGFFREHSDFCAQRATVRFAAIELFKCAANFRGPALMNIIFQFCQTKLESGVPENVDGALRLIGELKDRFVRRDEDETGVDRGIKVAPILETYALPLLTSEHDFLKFTAVFVYMKFASIMKTGNLLAPCEQILRLTDYSEIPIRAQACDAIKEFFTRQECYDLLRTSVGPLIKVILQSIIDTPSDGILETMSVLISTFRGDIVPHASEFLSNFLDQISKWIEDDDDHNGIMAQTSFPVMYNVVAECGKITPEATLPPLWQVLGPKLVPFLTVNGGDHFGHVLSIIGIFTKNYPVPFHETLWEYFGKTCEILCSMESDANWKNIFDEEIRFICGDDNVEIAVPTLVNYILRDPSFWTRTWKDHALVEIVQLTVQRLLQADEAGPIYILLASLFRSCPADKRTDLVKLIVPFLLKCVGQDARREDALYALCVFLYTDFALFTQAMPLIEFLEKLRLQSTHKVSQKYKRYARLQAVACIIRNKAQEIESYGPWMWECMGQDIEFVLDPKNTDELDELEFDGDFDGYSEHSQQLEDHEDARDEDIMFSQREFDLFCKDEFDLFANDDFRDMIPLYPEDQTLHEIAVIMNDYSHMCATKRWDKPKQMLESKLIGAPQ